MDSKQIKYDFIHNKTCPYCQSKIKGGADFIVCPHCGTPHHKECWNENGGCTTYGCIDNPQTEKKMDPGSADVGNETVEYLRTQMQRPAATNLIGCPNCKSVVEDGSVYCKFCGYNIAENKFPEENMIEAKKEFEKEYKKRYKDKANITRKRFLFTAGSFIILISAVALLFYITVNKLNDYFSSDEYKIRNTVSNWKEAWEDKNIEKFKNFLTGDYEYYGKDGKKVDLKEKIRRLESTFKSYKDIKINFSDFKIINDSSTTDTDKKVQVHQTYESDKFQETGWKTLRLFKGAETNNEWKIYREIFE